MKDLFPEHYEPTSSDRALQMYELGAYKHRADTITKKVYPSKDELKALYDEAILVFDTSALLNLYGLGEETLQAVLKVCDRFGDRLWLPYQTANEYHCNLLKVMIDNYNKFAEAAHVLKESTRKMSKLHRVNSGEFKAAVDALDRLADKSREEYLERCSSLKGRLGDLFNGRVGAKPSLEEEQSLKSAVQERFKRKRPPGYCDVNTKNTNSEGDGIAWLQAIEMAKAKQKPILWVTDETKTDWWLTVGSHADKVGPRPELVLEMSEQAGQIFWLQMLERFIELAVEHFAITASENVQQELDDRSADKDRSFDLIAYTLANGSVAWFEGAASEAFSRAEVEEKLATLGHLSEVAAQKHPSGTRKIHRVSAPGVPDPDNREYLMAYTFDDDGNIRVTSYRAFYI